MFDNYLPSAVNSGPWITAYTLERLRQLSNETKFVLPICSLATPFAKCVSPEALLLPPLYHEALAGDLKQKLVEQILRCFPTYSPDNSIDNACRLEVVEWPRTPLPPRPAPKILAFSVDTAVEEHGPHLPLGTDTLQSYSVLKALKQEREDFEIFRPIDYGQLTWGLPFGFSVDLTAPLLSEYVTHFANAVTNWLKPQACYVVDVHGSITHRQAIVDGLKASCVERWAFRWLHEPLAEFASARGDQHAGGVETALVEWVSSQLIDSTWFPARIGEIAKGQMSFQQAVDLTPDLAAFTKSVFERNFNGVVGDIHNYNKLDAAELFHRMLEIARVDVDQLASGASPKSQAAGKQLW